jgi:hypothetical protein
MDDEFDRWLKRLALWASFMMVVSPVVLLVLVIVVEVLS